MAEHLMSVRFGEDTLKKLRTLAEIHDSNVAEEVRTAVAQYLAGIPENADFVRKLNEANERRQERINLLMGNGSRPD